MMGFILENLLNKPVKTELINEMENYENLESIALSEVSLDLIRLLIRLCDDVFKNQVENF